MSKLKFYIFSEGYKGDLYVLNKLVEIIEKNNLDNVELWIFLKPEVDYYVWKEWFNKVLYLINENINLRISNGLNMFFESFTQKAILNYKFKYEYRKNFYEIFYPVILKSYFKAHKLNHSNIFLMGNEWVLSQFLNEEIQGENTYLIPSEIDETSLNYLKSVIPEIKKLWFFLKNGTLELKDVTEVKTFLKVLSNDVRQKIFYIVMENEGTTARKIQNILRKSGSKMSLTAILKHLNKLLKLNLVYKKDHIYYSKFSKLKITLLF